jgi:hypothetical protein
LVEPGRSVSPLLFCLSGAGLKGRHQESGFGGGGVGIGLRFCLRHFLCLRIDLSFFFFNLLQFCFYSDFFPSFHLIGHFINDFLDFFDEKQSLGFFCFPEGLEVCDVVSGGRYDVELSVLEEVNILHFLFDILQLLFRVCIEFGDSVWDFLQEVENLLTVEEQHHEYPYLNLPVLVYFVVDVFHFNVILKAGLELIPVVLLFVIGFVEVLLHHAFLEDLNKSVEQDPEFL